MRRTHSYRSDDERAALDARAVVEGSTRSDVLRSIADRELNLDDGPEVGSTLAHFAADN